MNKAGTPKISVLIATRNRSRSLAALLASLARAQPPSVAYEIIVADNGSEDETEELLRDWGLNASNRTVIRVEQPGRSRALNAAIETSRGEWLAFLDDDVVVATDYFVCLEQFCQNVNCGAAQGSILLAPEAKQNPELRELMQQFPEMIPQVEHPPDWQPQTLVGANMFARRDVLWRVGLYDERLGAGASGFQEDDELAERVLRSGEHIGYMAAVKVFHEVDRNRLTPNAYFERARKLGQSDYLRKRPSILTWLLPRLAITGLRLLFASLCGMSHQRRRALARWYRYWGALELAWGGRH